MLKRTLTAFVLPFVLLFGQPATGWSNSRKAPDSHGPSGTLQKMIVESGAVSLDLDTDRLSGDGSLAAKVGHLRFAVAATSLFSMYVCNRVPPGRGQGTMRL